MHVDRHLRFDRISNIRDLGGIPTSSGGRIRAGMVVRSGELSRLSAEDQQRLAAMGFRFVFDLRTRNERSNRPSRLWQGLPRAVHRDYGHSGADLATLATRPGLTADLMRDRMLSLYRTIAFDQSESFAMMMRAIAAGEVPMLFHCAGGKDRTGAFAALLLDALGVPRDAIAADYLLSNDWVDAARPRFLNHIDRGDIDPAVWEPLLRVEPEYLNAMFDAVARQHRDSHAYFTAIGIDAATITAVREILVEEA